jgi:hypothetical protein
VSFVPVKGTVQDIPPPIEESGPALQTFIVEPFDRLYEVYTPNSEGPMTVWKPFQHYKRTAEMSTSPLLVPQWTGSYNGSYDPPDHTGYFWGHLGYHQDKLVGFRGFGGADNPTQGLLPLFVPEANGGNFIPPPVDLDSLLQQGLKAMLPAMKEGLSLINSLIETRDFKSLPRTLLSAKSLVTSLRAISTKSSTGRAWDYIARKATAKEIRLVLADSYLQWSFNIAPLWSDVKGIYRSLTRLEKDVNRLITASAKSQQRHFTVPLSELSDSTDTVGPYIVGSIEGIYAQGTSYRYTRSETSKFHAMIEYNYNYTQFQLQHAALLSLLDSFSINLGLSKVIWNATRWTFVIDWVFGVSRYLDQFSMANMAPVINIRRALWSISRKRAIACTYDLYGADRSYPHAQGFPASTVQETAYRRELWQLTRSSIQSSGVNLKEFTLGAALVITRRRRHKRS